MNLQELVAHHYQNAPGFRERMDQTRLQPEQISTPRDLHALPVIRKDDLAGLQAARPPFAGFQSCQPGQLKRIFQSPGPTYDPESRVADYWRWEPALRFAGFDRGDIVLNAFGYHLTPAGAMFEEGLWAVGCVVVPGGVGNQEQQVQLLHTMKVTGYVGLPSYLKALLDKAQELNLELALKNAFVTAEPLPPSLRKEINAAGVTVRQGYGTAECGNLGFECAKEDGWHLPEDAIIEVCDINSGRPMPAGEMGEIVVTLFNPDYALLRFGTGDLSAVNPEPCDCGLKSKRLVGWLGRVGAATKVRGMFLHPRQVSELLSAFEEVSAAQLLISREAHRDSLTLRVVPSGETRSLEEDLKAAFRDGLKFRVSVEIVDSLPDDAPVFLDERDWELDA